MCGFIGGIITAIVGAVLIVVSTSIGYGVVPGIIENIIINEVVLINNTIQMERFEEVPFPLNFSIWIWNISNPEQVLAGGVPVMQEVGPYIYKLYQTRLIDGMDDDTLNYRILDNFEFDPEGSFPHTEDDMVTIINVAYHAVLQVAESMFPLLMPALNTGMNGIFGQFNTPIVDVRVRELLFDGIPMCQNPGLVGIVACAQIREISQTTQNLQIMDDGSLKFSLVSYKDGNPSSEYLVHRGLDDPADLGRISMFNGRPDLYYWVDNGDSGICNMVNGTDSGIFAPFVDRDTSLFALNTDICRSVELRYQYDLEYEGIPSVRFAANEWFLDNDEGCFCLNLTAGLTRDDGCMRAGAMELFTCVGAFLVLSYPHFLYADLTYRNGVIGMNPIEEEHRIFVDLEPNTGTVIRGGKRAQFNIFSRPITGIPATQNLRTTLTPIFWVEEGMSLPEEYVNELKTRLLMPLTLVDILFPIAIAVCCIVFLIGILIIIRAVRQPKAPIATSTPNVEVASSSPVTKTSE